MSTGIREDEPTSSKRPKLEPGTSVHPKLLNRKWLEISPTSISEVRSEIIRDSFKVMQFNTLADALAHSTFIKCPKATLKWACRGPLLIKEILRAGADIVCLEEVDHYDDFFKPELSLHGYEGLHLPKVDSPCVHFPDNNGPDGCAMFYSSEKFNLIRKKEVILKNTDGGESHQVALLAEFRMKHVDVKNDEELPSVFVAMTHFKAKPEGKSLRTAQGKHLIDETSTFSGTGQPVIIAGDFNANPEEEVYEYFSNTDDHPQLTLKSAYRGPHYNNNEPPFTSWKFRAKGELEYTIDYIWYTPSRLSVKRVWDIPTKKEIGEDGLPCSSYPSDHVALCSEFKIINKE